MSADLPRSTEVAIIGGGIMGTSIAWQLARRGVREVTVLDRATVAAGASGRTGALLRQHYSNRPEAMLAHLSHDVFKIWPDVVGGDCGFVPSGLIVTVPTGEGSEGNLDLLHKNVSMQRGLGVDTSILSLDQLHDLQPFARFDDVAAAAYEPTTGYVDAIAATRSMALAAIREGAQIVEGCEVFDLVADGDRIVGVRTSAGFLAANVVVCAAGPWSPQILTSVGVDIPVTALRVQVVVVQRPLELEPPHLAYVDTAAGMFCRPWGPGRSLIGVAGGDQHEDVDPNDFDARNDSGYPAQAISAVSHRIPAMAGASYVYGYACLYDMTPDTHAIIGKAGLDGLYVAAGFSGAGFKKGPAVGQCLAEQIIDGQSSTVDLTPFRLERFVSDEWRRAWSDTEYVFTTDFGHGF